MNANGAANLGINMKPKPCRRHMKESAAMGTLCHNPDSLPNFVIEDTLESLLYPSFSTRLGHRHPNQIPFDAIVDVRS